MRPVIVVLLIGVGCLVSTGCVPIILWHGYTHPHSAVTAPTFCLYWGEDEHSQPIPIYEISVIRYEAFSDDERFEWHNWRSEQEPFADEVTWVMQYVPDDEAHPPARPLSCITYGKAPPGYDELIPPLPLIPERMYTVSIRPTKYPLPMSRVYFIIRADSTGHPIQLEVNNVDHRERDNIHIITPE